LVDLFELKQNIMSLFLTQGNIEFICELTCPHF